MFTNHPILDNFDYMKERTGTWLSEQMGHSISTVSRWMTNKVQPSVEQLYEIARHLDVDVKELLVSSK